MLHFFLECTIRAALIVGATAIVLYSMRVKVASVKHRVWTSVLLLMLVLPLWIAWGPKAPIRILPPNVEDFTADLLVQTSPSTSAALQKADTSQATPVSTQPLISPLEWSFLGLYLFGALIFLARLAIGTSKARRLIRDSSSADSLLRDQMFALCTATPISKKREKSNDPECSSHLQIPKLRHPEQRPYFRALRRIPLAFSCCAAEPAIATSNHPHRIQISSACAAPVTVGCFRPTILLPENWRDWSASQLAAVLAHESEHARRRDPLIQWLALFNRAIFWFHPAARWLERELSALAEESCDAAVLAQGHDPNAYAETLMHMARAIMHSGSRVNAIGTAMPGPGLPHRIRNIIDAAPIAQISRIRGASIIAVCIALCASFASGTLGHARQASSSRASAVTPAAPQVSQESPNLPELRFDAASLRPRDHDEPVGIIGMQTFPGRLLELCASLNDLIWYAYHITWVHPEGLPDWARKPCTDGSPEYTYDFQATMPPNTTTDEARQMMQRFLAERFKLAVHWEKREMPVYALVVAPGGFKLKPFQHTDSPPAATKFVCPAEDPACHRMLMTSRGASQLATVLSNTIDRPVLDKTGLTDAYTFDLRWAGDMSADSPLPSLADALRDDFGLELKSATAPADTLVVDHAEKPTPN